MDLWLRTNVHAVNRTTFSNDNLVASATRSRSMSTNPLICVSIVCTMVSASALILIPNRPTTHSASCVWCWLSIRNRTSINDIHWLRSWIIATRSECSPVISSRTWPICVSKWCSKLHNEFHISCYIRSSDDRNSLHESFRIIGSIDISNVFCSEVDANGSKRLFESIGSDDTRTRSDICIRVHGWSMSCGSICWHETNCGICGNRYTSAAGINAWCGTFDIIPSWSGSTIDSVDIGNLVCRHRTVSVVSSRIT